MNRIFTIKGILFRFVTFLALLLCVFTANSQCTATVVPPAISICIGTQTTLTASGGVTYVWNDGSVTPSITVSPATTQVYCVTITDATSCTASACAVVTVNPNALAVITPPAVTICTGLSTTLCASGGTSYVWSDGQTGSCITVGSFGGCYTVTATDANGCTGTATSCVTVVSAPGVFIYPDTVLIICPGSTDSLRASPGGGSPPYTYTWANGATTSTINNLTPGIYTVTVTDANGCSTSGSSHIIFAATCPCGILYTSSCLTVCERSQTNYTATYHAGSTYQWFVSGADSSSASGNNISVWWQSDSLSHGNGSITYIETLSTGGTDSVAICYRIGEAPVTSFTTNPPPLLGVVNICAGTGITFINQSANANTSYWNFGDGNTSSLTSPTEVFRQIGDFMVHLTSTNLCGCSTSDSILVHVTHSPGPDVECASVVCAGDTSSYYTSMVCSTYNWSVTGGTILSPQPYGSSILVQWGNGSNGNGTVTLDIGTCSGLCSTPSSINIPIVSPNTQITGATVVCRGDDRFYSVPNVPGVTFNWSVAQGQIISGQGTHAIEVLWNGSTGIHNVSVNYNFTLLGCGGSGVLAVTVAPVLSVTSNSAFCYSDSFATITAVLQGYVGNYSWLITNPGGSTINLIAPSPLLYHFPAIGNYSVSITPNPPVVGVSCNDTARCTFSVQTATPPTGITGATMICPGNTYQYTASGATNGCEFAWQVSGGTLNSTIGDVVSVTWNITGPYSLSVKQQQLSSPNCQSDTITLRVYPYILPPVAGVTDVCANAQSTYNLAGAIQPGVYYQWSVTPSLGSVISGQGTENITIEWLNASGTATVLVTALDCNNQTASLNVAVHSPLAPDISPNAPSFCNGAGVTLTSTPASSYLWKDSLGAVLGSAQSVYVTRGGRVRLTTYDAYGCHADTGIYVSKLPSPVASITTTSPNIFCIPLTVNANLYALTAAGYTYQWKLNVGNAPGSANNPTYNATQGGNYYVVVTDSNGCTASSNALTFASDSCNGGGPGNTCTVAETVDFTFSGCNPVNFAGTFSSVNVTNPQWTFDDSASTVNNFAVGMNATHTFTSAGYYRVFFYGLAPNLTPPPNACTIEHEHIVAIYANAGFKFTPACAGTPLQFTDLSTYLTGYPITTWNWDFGDTHTSNVQSPANIYANAGAYTVTLTVVSTGCSSTISQQIIVPGITANGSYSPTPVCQNTPVHFSDLSLDPDTINKWQWFFGDGTNSLNQNPNKTFDSSGTRTITLTASDVAGCSDSFSFSLVIQPVPNGTITPPGPVSICAGQTINLVAPVGISWRWSTGLTAQTFTDSIAGNYFVEVTTANNCKYVTPTVKVNVNPLPPAEIISGSQELCYGDATTLTALTQPNQTYTWTQVGCCIVSNVSSYSLSAFFSGVHQYYVRVHNSLTGCNNQSANFAITVHPLPNVPTLAQVPNGTNCSGHDVTISVSNPVNTISYQWSTGNVDYYNGGPAPSITTSLAGDYSVSAVDTFGCKNISQPLTIYPQPDFSSVLTGCYDICDTTTVTVYGPPGTYTRQWLKLVNGYWTLVSTAVNLQITSEGIYVLVLTTPQGCTDTSDILSLNPLNCCGMHIHAHGAVINCADAKSGMAAVDSPTGPGITYLWSDGETTQSISGLSGGTVYVDVASGNCRSMATVAVQSPAPLPVPVVTYRPDTLFSSITDTIYTYQWYLGGALIPGATSPQYVSTIQPVNGCFSVIITDINGCTATDSLCVINSGIPSQTLNSNSVSLYPNPSLNTNTVEVNLISPTQVSIELFNAEGKRLKEMQNQKFPAGKNTVRFNLEELAAGIYTYKIIIGNGEVQRLKFVKTLR